MFFSHRGPYYGSVSQIGLIWADVLTGATVGNERMTPHYTQTLHGTAIDADQLGWFGGSMGRHIWQSHGASGYMLPFLDPFAVRIVIIVVWGMDQPNPRGLVVNMFCTFKF